MIDTLAMSAAPSRPISTDCPGSERCEWTPARVRWYLICWQLALRVHEPFANVLGSESRNSRDIDPWIRGGRVDPERGRSIGLSLEHARDDGGLDLRTYNADRISSYLCPNDHSRDGTR